MSNETSTGIYFSFHQERDAERAELVMSHSLTREADVASIWTQEDWDTALARGEDYAQLRIAEVLEGVSATCLLIGERTVEKPWIRPVLKTSHKLGIGIFAVYIHTIPDYSGNVCKKGPNPMGSLKYTGRGDQEYPYSSYYFTYDWTLHDGANRFSKWVDISLSQVMNSDW